VSAQEQRRRHTLNVEKSESVSATASAQWRGILTTAVTKR